jgi:glucans biosynthesis protein C
MFCRRSFAVKQKMEKIMNNNLQRRYDLDWLRVIAILLVLVFHVGMIYNSWGWHIKSKNTSRFFDYWMMWAHTWRMPLLLLISGAGTYYAAGTKTLMQIFGERNRRLLIPLIFSMLVIVPPQIYFERIANFESYWEFYKTVFDFVPYPEGGSLSWHHMWFVLYLLFYSIIALPLLAFIRKNPLGGFVKMLDFYFTKKWAFLSGIVLVIFSQILLRPYFPEETHGLFDDWAYFVQYGIYYFFGIIISAGSGIWDNLEKRRTLHLKAGLISLSIMWALYSGLWGFLAAYIPNNVIEIFWDINSIVAGWSWVITIAGYGKKYLNKKSVLLKYSNEGIYPFYIVHQTVIIFIGYHYLQYSGNIFIGYTVVCLLSFIASAGIYILFIRPFNIMRFIFGMKPVKSKHLAENEKLAA